MSLKILNTVRQTVEKRDNRKANPARCNKSKHASAQMVAKYGALGRPIVL